MEDVSRGVRIMDQRCEERDGERAVCPWPDVEREVNGGTRMAPVGHSFTPLLRLWGGALSTALGLSVAAGGEREGEDRRGTSLRDVLSGCY